MKTIRTILATFGVTTALYGVFALISVRLNPAFTGRSVYQLFRDTGFVALVIGIGCVLSFVIMTIAIASFRDDGGRKKHESEEDDLFDDFIEEETVPEERAEEADESWSPEIKRKQRRALRHTDEEPTPDLFADDDDDGEDEVSPQRFRRQEREETSAEAETPIPLRGMTETEDDAAFRPMREEPAEEAPEAEKPAEKPAATKRCVYCGETIDADSAFCIFCGKRV